MKNFYLSLVLVLTCASISFAQNIDFSNSGGDFLWSNTANWNTGVLPTSDNVVRFLQPHESVVDADLTIKRLQVGFGPASDISVNGTNTLTINPGADYGAAIQNASGQGIKFSIKCKININNTAGNTVIRSANNDADSMEFAAGSLLTLTTPVATNVFGTTPINHFYFNGSIEGSSSFTFGNNTINTFGSTATNAAYTGEMVFFGNAEATVNTADDAVFYNGPKIQVNGDGSSLTLNSANVFASMIVVDGTNAFGFTANKNQSSMSEIILSGAGTLNLTIGSGVTNLSFADNSASTWADGSTLNITGYAPGIVRFGGLTAAQLSKIVVDGSGGAVALDSDGYLVNASSLSVADFEKNAINPIAYPTLTSDRLYFNKPQNNVKIFNLTGKLLKHNTSKNQSEIGVDFLSAGLYLIVFDNQKVEKFLKK